MTTNYRTSAHCPNAPPPTLPRRHSQLVFAPDVAAKRKLLHDNAIHSDLASEAAPPEDSPGISKCLIDIVGGHVDD